MLGLLGASTAGEIMGLEDFRDRGIPLRTSTEDGSEGTRGRVTDLLEAALAEPATSRTAGGPASDRATVYACGPTAMMRRCAEIAAARGSRCLVSLENHMACGFGVCLGCAAPLAAGGYALVCREGPMFDAAALDWDGLP